MAGGTESLLFRLHSANDVPNDAEQHLLHNVVEEAMNHHLWQAETALLNPVKIFYSDVW